MTRSTRTALLVAIVLLLAGGVATAVVRESRDETSTSTAPAVTLPDAVERPAQGSPTTAPSAVTATSVPPGPVTVPSPASPSTGPSGVPPTTVAVSPSGAPSGAPTSTSVAPPLTAMPNTGGGSLPALGVLLLAAGLLGWRLSSKGRTAG